MSDLFDEVTAVSDDAKPMTRRERREAEERQRRRTKRVWRTAIIILLALIIVGVVAYFMIPRVQDLFDISTTPSAEDYEGPGHGETQVSVEPGMSGAEIGNELVDAGVVASQRAFTDALAENPEGNSIQPGNYTLQLEMPATDAVSALVSGDSRESLTVTVPEGFTTWQVHERVAATMDVDLDEVEAAAEDIEAIGLPNEADGNPEGWYAPATYEYNSNDTPADLLAEMVSLQIQRLDEIGVPEGEERQELLNQASIVEREVNIDEYLPQVAAVIENRLDQPNEVNGRLDMDSTVLYGVGETGGMPTGDQLADADNEYNTYQHAGLPPTPIASPGLDTLEAVQNPADGDWLYFVTVDLDTGETLFADTLSEHNANVEVLREWQQENQ